ncbi:MAG: MASE1 domain-containing protein [Acidobacteriota bacterium]
MQRVVSAFVQHRRFHALALVMLSALAYFASARVGYALAIPAGIVTLWPPAGVMLGLLALKERRDWPYLLVGGFLGCLGSDLLQASPIGRAVLSALANQTESVVAAWLLTRALGTPARLVGLRSVLYLTVGAAVFANGATALLGAAILHAAFSTSWGEAWFVWWVGDGLGMLSVAPLLLTWARPESLPGRRQAVEAVFFLVVLLLAGQLVLGPRHGWVVEPDPYISIPILIWAAARLGPRGAATGSIVLAVLATWHAALGVGPFVTTGQTGVSTAMQLHAFVALATLSSLVPAVVLEERSTAWERLRRTEQRMRFALEAAGVGLWEADWPPGSVHWSTTLKQLHGMAPGAFAGTFEAFLDRVHPEDRHAVQHAIDRAGREGAEWRMVYRTTWPDGSLHWLSSLGRVTPGKHGTPGRAAGIAVDVTNQQQTEEQLRQSQKMEAVGQLAGGIAHDFNNLLTAIQGYGSLLAQALPPASPLQADLGEIHRAVSQATSLVDQLLAFSRQQVLAPRVLSLSDSVKAMVPMLTRLIGEHIEVAVATEAAGHVAADPGQIEQVVLNLVINARDAMPNGGRLTLQTKDVLLDEAYASLRVGVNPGPHVMLVVGDTGVGMDAATAARVFEPFFTTKAKGRGTGLGLATVHGIIKQSGGHIWVYTEPGAGSVFRAYLPCVDAPVDPIEPETVSRPQGRSATLLVVEDDRALRKLAVRALKAAGHRVLEAGTPSEALEIETGWPDRLDLLLTDVVMPGMNGFELAARLVERRPDLRILYMSGYADDALVPQGGSLRDVPFLQKPFSPDALARKVHDVLADAG